MRVALEAGGLSAIEQSDLTATRLGEAPRKPVIEREDFAVRLHNLQSCRRASDCAQQGAQKLGIRKRPLRGLRFFRHP
jgi:hypothetical protein